MRISDNGMKKRRARWVGGALLLAAALVCAAGGCYQPLHDPVERPAAVPRPTSVPQTPR